MSTMLKILTTIATACLFASVSVADEQQNSDATATNQVVSSNDSENAANNDVVTPDKK